MISLVIRTRVYTCIMSVNVIVYTTSARRRTYIAIYFIHIYEIIIA